MRRGARFSGALLAVFWLAAGATAEPIVVVPMHGYEAPGPITTMHLKSGSMMEFSKKTYFEGASELLHIGPVELSYFQPRCVVAPCPPLIDVSVNGRQIPNRELLIVDETGSRLSTERPSPEFGRLWRDEDTRMLLVQQTQAPASIPDRISMENRTGQLLRGVYVTPSTVDYWGKDLAPANIRAGETTSVPLEAGHCLHDIRLKLDYPGDEQLLMGVDVCASPSIVIGPETGQRIKRRE